MTHQHVHAPVWKSIHSQQKPEPPIFSQNLQVTLPGPTGVMLNTADGASRSLTLKTVTHTHTDPPLPPAYF